MSASSFIRLGLLSAAVGGSLGLGACSSMSDHTKSVLYTITPYKIEVVQGNFVSKQQVEALKPGMTRQQVAEILGTPLLMDVFHNNRWDYVFTIRRPGVEPQQRHLTVFFNGERLDRFEGDSMPSEEEFVATLDTRPKNPKVPPLEATEDQLKKYEPPKGEDKAAAPAATSAMPPPAASYPPLEQ